MKPKLPYLLCIGLSVALAWSRTRSSKLEAKLDSLTESSRVSRQTSRVSDRDGNENSRASRPGTTAFTSVREILANRDPLSRTAALLAYADSLSPDQLAGALDELRRTVPHWDPDGKMLAHLLLTRWAQADPEAALASLKDVDLKKNSEAPISVLSAVAGDDPDRARAWLEDPANAMATYPWVGQFLAGAVAKEWVRTDPDAALNWARNLPDSQQAGAYSGVLGTMVMTDPAKAAELAVGLEDNGARSHILGEIADAWAASDPTAAADWAMGLEGSARQAALGRVFGTLARTDPAGAAERVTALGDDGAALVLPVVESWAPRDPQAAANWTISQPQAENSGRALGTALWHWTNQNAEEASTWLGAQPASPALDGGIAGLAKAASSIDPEAAVGWANSISNPELRDRMVTDSLNNWRKSDADAANRWSTENLPEK